MKKIILVAVFVMCHLVSVFGQKIIHDRIENDGRRLIVTDEFVCRNLTDKVVLSCALSYSEFQEISSFNLVANISADHPLEIKEGSRMLIKLFDDSVIELTTFSSSETHRRKVYAGYIITYIHTMDAFFEITKEQLHNIITKGVKKIRIETFPDYYDNVFKKDKLGKQLDKRFQMLEQAISSPKEFDDDF